MAIINLRENKMLRKKGQVITVCHVACLKLSFTGLHEILAPDRVGQDWSRFMLVQIRAGM